LLSERRRQHFSLNFDRTDNHAFLCAQTTTAEVIDEQRGVRRRHFKLRDELGRRVIFEEMRELVPLAVKDRGVLGQP
jgi:hypothetical protein